MKKLYRKGTVHPSPSSPPPPPSPMMSEQYLSFLPAAILTLAAELSAEDREVLAYLLLSSSNRPKRPSPSSSSGAAARGSSCDHAPQFGCDCFRCYTSYWVRWGSSPNRQLIHEIIEAFEDHDHRTRCHAVGSGQKGGARGGRRERRSNKQRGGGGGGDRGGGSGDGAVLSTGESKRAELTESEPAESEAVRGGEGEEEASAEKGSSQVRRLVSFIGERIWGVWG